MQPSFFRVMNKIIISLFTIFLLFAKSFAQGEVVMPFLLIHPSPRLNGMAGAFTALPTSDPFGHYFNPSQLGNFSRENNISYSFHTPTMRWLPSFNFPDLYLDSKALSIGYNFKNLSPSIPISIGMGYINTLLNLGTNLWIDERGNVLGGYDSKEYYTAYSCGIGVDYYIKFNLGYTHKDITSNLAIGLIDSEDKVGSAKANAYDIGLQLTVPAISIIEKIKEINITIFGNFKPSADFHFGYAIMNIGDEVSYGSIWGNPLPRTAQMGIALSLGIDMPIKDIYFPLAKFDWSSEARDLLIDRYQEGTFKYVSAPGDIAFWNNIIKGNYTEKVYVYRGWRIQLLDFFEYNIGNYNGGGYGDDGVNTSSYMIRSKGMIKLLAMHFDNNILNFIADHFEASYACGSYSSKDSPISGSTFNGVTLTIFGF